MYQEALPFHSNVSPLAVTFQAREGCHMSCTSCPMLASAARDLLRPMTTAERSLVSLGRTLVYMLVPIKDFHWNMTCHWSFWGQCWSRSCFNYYQHRPTLTCCRGSPVSGCSAVLQVALQRTSCPVEKRESSGSWLETMQWSSELSTYTPMCPLAGVEASGNGVCMNHSLGLLS